MQGGNGKHYVAYAEEELIRRLHDGYKLIQSLVKRSFCLKQQINALQRYNSGRRKLLTV